jgi:hypothetical protein
MSNYHGISAPSHLRNVMMVAKLMLSADNRVLKSFNEWFSDRWVLNSSHVTDHENLDIIDWIFRGDAS